MIRTATVLFALMPLPVFADAMVCIPDDFTQDPVRFDVDEDIGIVTLFKTGETFVLVENTPTQLTFEEGYSQDRVTLNYIAKVDSDTPGQWIADTLDDAGTLVTERIGICFVL